MKNILMPLLFLVLLIFTTACEDTKKEGNTIEKGSEYANLETALRSMELPDNFLIDFDPNEVQIVEAAKIHTTSFLEMDEKKVKKELIQGEIISTENNAHGLWIEAGDKEYKEYLTIYDGGEALGVDSGVNGGIYYSAVIDWNKLSMVVSTDPGFSDNNGEPYKEKNDYQSFVNLSFKNYSEALTEVEELLSSIGFPDLEIAEAYSLDLDTILEHYNLYIDSGNSVDEEYIDDEELWSVDDESYLFFFRQTVDDIPLVNINWQEGVRATGEATETSISVIYSKEGMIISADGLFNVLESGKKEPLISGTSALKKLLDFYSGYILEEETKVFSMELCYVGILRSDKNYELVPAWVFGIAKTSERTDPENGTKDSYDSYSYYVINAITGERIRKASEEQ
ncbi:hypothetical protein MUB24_03845 [Lederbergia sp. NSJ-179]|uniref:hypothetical protein n=1 Tax=Lederbergia sp. NSJ-179 TaxID=2931402 RepID=UPI001FCFB760|nr:hypothetical protein [Lederbergia sp. NSJ-179]MCJ7840057.1 hypothetical protein [Lederbergia sp. NSJ-179]